MEPYSPAAFLYIWYLKSLSATKFSWSRMLHAKITFNNDLSKPQSFIRLCWPVANFAQMWQLEIFTSLVRILKPGAESALLGFAAGNRWDIHREFARSKMSLVSIKSSLIFYKTLVFGSCALYTLEYFIGLKTALLQKVPKYINKNI